MPTLKPNPRLADLQAYVIELERERGFSTETVLQKCLLLGEEVGELFKAIRKDQGMPTDEQSKISTTASEIADVFIILCAIANRLNVDLETAFREKEVINSERVWK